ncbi:hypothetical protein [Escherichia coli]|jgi:hypothetical protein|uniref:hypothetical protein n=1 Tax=Escherichia coli TaxID=562 RepID=UPI0003EF68C0|nr:hypothetical protein [Escherichia coli]EAA9538543.1 hypothetical protein [Salmonella enterica subsp. enterica]EEU9374474.1 hypothetical protein [Escherichia coli]EFA5368847.1 hypothetical protein [Escherichia coli]EFN0907643.1 hypothetical protein [Escherichia coli]EFO1684705.1 hypothetical protein [Escherichia coli]
MDEKYRRFVDEVDFSRQLLGIGLTSLRKANFASRGLYFQALSGISLGLERLMKLCLMLDDYNKNGKYTSRKKLRDYGHNLSKLFNLVIERVDSPSGLNEIHYRVMELLTNFANSSRYSNIDFITNDNDNDPMKQWYNEIDKSIYDKILTKRQKNIIDKKCEQYRSYGETLPCYVLGYYDEDRNHINSAGDLNYLLKRSEMLAGYRTLLVIHIIECIYNILDSMTVQAKDNHFHHLELGRFFATIIYGSDRDKINRKNFIRM